MNDDEQAAQAFYRGVERAAHEWRARQAREASIDAWVRMDAPRQAHIAVLQQHRHIALLEMQGFVRVEEVPAADTVEGFPLGVAEARPTILAALPGDRLIERARQRGADPQAMVEGLLWLVGVGQSWS